MAVPGDPPQIKFTNNLTSEGAMMPSTNEGAPLALASNQTSASTSDSSAMVTKWKNALEKRKVKSSQTQRQPGTLSLYQKASFFGQRGPSPIIKPQSPIAKLQPGVHGLKSPSGGIKLKVAPVIPKPYVKVRPSEQQYKAILTKTTATVSPLKTTPTVVAQQCRMPSSFTILTPVVTPPPLVALAPVSSEPQPVIIRQIPVKQAQDGTTVMKSKTHSETGSSVTSMTCGTPFFSHIKGIDVNTRLRVPGFIVPICRPQPSNIRQVQTVVCSSGNEITKTSSIISSTQHQIQSILSEYTNTLTPLRVNKNKPLRPIRPKAEAPTSTTSTTTTSITSTTTTRATSATTTSTTSTTSTSTTSTTTTSTSTTTTSTSTSKPVVVAPKYTTTAAAAVPEVMCINLVIFYIISSEFMIQYIYKYSKGKRWLILYEHETVCNGDR